MALFVFTLLVVALLAALGIYVLRNAPLRTPYEVARDYDPAEALSFVWSEIPAAIRERLGRDGVASVLEYELDFMKQAGAVLNGKRPRNPSRAAVIGSAQTVDYILERAEREGLEVTAEDVHTIIEAEIGYLAAIGAIGGQAPPPDAEAS